MLRIILGAVIGFVIAFATMAATNRIGFELVVLMFPIGSLEGMSRAEQDHTLNIVRNLQDAHSCIAWFLGTLIGPAAANLIAARKRIAGRAVSGLLLALMALFALVSSYQPWVTAASFAGLLAGAWIADNFFNPMPPKVA